MTVSTNKTNNPTQKAPNYKGRVILAFGLIFMFWIFSAFNLDSAKPPSELLLVRKVVDELGATFIIAIPNKPSLLHAKKVTNYYKRNYAMVSRLQILIYADDAAALVPWDAPEEEIINIGDRYILLYYRNLSQGIDNYDEYPFM